MKKAAILYSCLALQDLLSCFRLVRLPGRRQLAENSWILNKAGAGTRDPVGYDTYTRRVHLTSRAGQILQPCEKLKDTIQELKASRLLGRAAAVSGLGWAAAPSMWCSKTPVPCSSAATHCLHLQIHQGKEEQETKQRMATMN